VKALNAADEETLLEWCTTWEAAQPAAAAQLRALVEAFEYDRILTLLQQESVQ